MSGSTLLATMRSSRVSRAQYTSPIPPAPIGSRISYGPSRVPGLRLTSGADYRRASGNQSRPGDEAAVVRIRMRDSQARCRSGIAAMHVHGFDGDRQKQVFWLVDKGHAPVCLLYTSDA